MLKADFIRRASACERRLYRIARTMLPCDADCEDAVQEALLRAWSKRDSLREEAYFETWLVRILINECRSFHRRRQNSMAALPENLPAPRQESTLLEALTTLPEKHRIALELHCIEGYSVRETANILRLPEGTVKWRLSRGRALLKQELGEEADL